MLCEGKMPCTGEQMIHVILTKGLPYFWKEGWMELELLVYLFLPKSFYVASCAVSNNME